MKAYDKFREEVRPHKDAIIADLRAAGETSSEQFSAGVTT
jgi:hypothetical protein